MRFKRDTCKKISRERLGEEKKHGRGEKGK